MSNIDIFEIIKRCRKPDKNEIDKICDELKKRLVSMEVDKRNLVLLDTNRNVRYKMFNCVDVKPKRGKILVRYNYHRIQILTIDEAKDYINKINNGFFGFYNNNEQEVK